jgi:hypothetical protein
MLSFFILIDVYPNKGGFDTSTTTRPQLLIFDHTSATNMLSRFIVFLAVIASAFAFLPTNVLRSRTARVEMALEDIPSKMSKAFGAALIATALAGPITAIPQNSFADGAVSKSTVYRARNNYGARISSLEKAANEGDFSKFEDKKIRNAFDLFISQANSLNSVKDKENKKTELGIQKELYAAVEKRDASKLKSSFAEFMKVADLKSSFKPGELGQTDSSGYSPTWGTERQYIYQR